MKLRIKGNSLRIRLNRSEVASLANTGYLQEETSFGETKFVYALQRVDEGDALSARLDSNKITMLVPKTLIQDWPVNDVIGFSADMQLPENNSLFLLLEKDFVCLDETTEDQSDNYQNPNKTC